MSGEPEELKGRALGLCVAVGTLVAAVLALRVLWGFRAWESQWWSWAGRYWLSEGHPPWPETITVVVVILAGVIFTAVIPYPMHTTKYGRAAWARWFDLAPLKDRIGLSWSRELRAGVVLGRWNGRFVTMSKSLSVLVFGPTRTGKSAGVFVPTILNLPARSVIVNDPSGDMFGATHKFRAQLGPVVMLRWDGDSPGKFNPLARDVLPADSSGRGDLVDQYSVSLISGSAEKGFWREGGIDSLSAATMYVIYREELRNRDATFHAVLSFLSTLIEGEDAEEAEDPQRSGLEKAAKFSREAGFPPRIADGLLRLAGQDFKTRANLLATVFAALRVFNSEHVQRTTSGTSFRLSDLRGVVEADGKRQPLSIYCVCRPAAQETYGPVTALFLEAVYTMLSSQLPANGELGVTLLLDEVNYLPTSRVVRDGPPILAKYDANLVLGFQDRSQIKAKYGEETLSILDTNTDAKVILTVNQIDTAEWVEKVIGKKTEKRRSSSHQTEGVGVAMRSQGQSVQDEGIPLVTTQDALGLPFGDQLVIFKGRPHRPAYCKAAFFYQYEPFKSRAVLGARPVA